MLFALVVYHWSPLNRIIFRLPGNFSLWIIPFPHNGGRLLSFTFFFFCCCLFQPVRYWSAGRRWVDGWFNLNPDIASVYWVLLTVGKLQSDFLTDTLVSHLLLARRRWSFLRVSPDPSVSMLARVPGEVFVTFDLLMLITYEWFLLSCASSPFPGCPSLLRPSLEH